MTYIKSICYKCWTDKYGKLTSYKIALTHSGEPGNSVCDDCGKKCAELFTDTPPQQSEMILRASIDDHFVKIPIDPMRKEKITRKYVRKMVKRIKSVLIHGKIKRRGDF